VIASAGVIGVAIGLGAQTLVRDILSGIFMLIEDQYGVGDQIKVLDIEGVVEKVGLRITTIRDKQDVLWYVRNGEILVIGNGSQKR
jgi:small-conductance mechanosensitive channel